MKRSLLLLLLMSVIFVSCNENVDPPIPIIKEYDITVLDKDDVPVNEAIVNVYMQQRPDFLVMNKTSNPFGKVHLINLKPGNYIFKVLVGEKEMSQIDVIVSEDNTLNISNFKLTNYQVKVASCSVVVKDDRGNPIRERKVDLTLKESEIILKSGVTNASGVALFEKVPLDDYFVKVYDDKNSSYQLTEAITIVEGKENRCEIEIVKLFHNSDFIISGMMVDPKGSDSPKNGAVSGDGYAHLGGYEYIQFLALKDIDFTVTPYCIVIGNNKTQEAGGEKVTDFTKAEFGWIQSKKDNRFTTYQINLTMGNVKKGNFFYVGGKSRMISSYYKSNGSLQVGEDRWTAVDYYYKAGDDENGIARAGKGIFNNLSGAGGKNTADGVAVFKGTIIDENSIPQDVVFYGTYIGNEGNYQITDNDHYKRQSSKGEMQTCFGMGTNTWFAKQDFHDNGCYIKMGGKVNATEWLIPRTGTAIKLNLKDVPEASLIDIETGSDITVFAKE